MSCKVTINELYELNEMISDQDFKLIEIMFWNHFNSFCYAVSYKRLIYPNLIYQMRLFICNSLTP